MALQDYNDLYAKSMTKKMRLTFNDADETVITNSEICSEEMSLEEALYSDDYPRIGACESSCFKVRVVNSGSFKGLTVVVEQLINDELDFLATDDGDYIVDEDENYIVVTPNTDFGTSIPYGTFKVYSDEPSNDRMWRDLTCYDAMYDIINADVREWYEGLTFPMTIKQLRDSFFTYLGITQETRTLVNDNFVTNGNFVVEGTLSGKTVLEAICELNGVFGHINRANKMDYISVLSTGHETVTLSWYIDGSGKYEDYTTDAITGIVARKENGDVGTSVGTDTNPYYITDNPLIYGAEGTTELSTALTNLLDKIALITFRPFEIETYGNPMLPIGTAITINTKKYDPENGYSSFAINSFVNHRELVGIQALKDVFQTQGEKQQSEEVNSISSEIKATKYKTHILENTVDTFKSEIQKVDSVLAYTATMRSFSSGLYLTQVDGFLSDEEYENLIGTEVFGNGDLIENYYLASDNDGKNVLDIYSLGVSAGYPWLYASDGTDWNLVRQSGTLMPKTTVSRIYVHDTQNDSSFVDFVLEQNVGWVMALKITQNITISGDGLIIQMDLPSYQGGLNRTCVRPVYKDGEMLTSSDSFSEGETIYLKYIEYSDISDERNPYGFKYVWELLDDNLVRETSIIEQLSNEIVLKVDSNGHIASVSLTADADTATSTLELEADDINFQSFNLNMSTTNFQLTSDYITIDENGIEINKLLGNRILINGDYFRVENPNDDDIYTSIGISEIDMSALHRVPNYSDMHTFEATYSDNGISISDTDLNESIVIETTNITSTQAWGGISTSLQTALGSLANVGDVQSAEPSAVNVGSGWTKLGGVTLPKGRWLIIATARFAENSTGRRGILISTSASVSSASDAVGQLAINNQSAISGTTTYVQTHWITSNLSSSTSFYLHGWQNSGSTLSTLPRITAVRIR